MNFSERLANFLRLNPIAVAATDIIMLDGRWHQFFYLPDSPVIFSVYESLQDLTDSNEKEGVYLQYDNLMTFLEDFKLLA